MRRFILNREVDESGISGTGLVLSGVVLHSGRTVIEWRPPHSSITIFDSFDEFKAIHVDCHPGCSEIVWLDPPTRSGDVYGS